MADKIPARLYKQWLEKQVGVSVYWYGTSFDACTVAKLQEKTKQFPQHYTSDRMARYQADIDAGKIAGDCVGGAIKGAAWTKLGTQKKSRGRYGCPDKSADGMFEYCQSQNVAWGEIGTLPETPCIAVRKSGHVGMYVGNGKVVEWMGFDYGCVMTDLGKRPWTHWYMLPWVDYDDIDSSGSSDPVAPSAPSVPEKELERKAVVGKGWAVFKERPTDTLGFVSEPVELTVYGEVNGFAAVQGTGWKGWIDKHALGGDSSDE